MKSLFLSLLLILGFSLSTQAVDQLDQTSRIVKGLNTHVEFATLSIGQELLPKIKPLSSALVSFLATNFLGPLLSNLRFKLLELTLASTSNFISSGASLVHHLSRLRF